MAKTPATRAILTWKLLFLTTKVRKDTHAWLNDSARSLFPTAHSHASFPSTLHARSPSKCNIRTHSHTYAHVRLPHTVTRTGNKLGKSQCTRVVKESLNPTWNQQLLLYVHAHNRTRTNTRARTCNKTLTRSQHRTHTITSFFFSFSNFLPSSSCPSPTSPPPPVTVLLALPLLV